MGFIELCCNSKTAEYSQSTDAGENPVFKFGSGVGKKVKGLKVTEVIVPYTWYNWWPSNYYNNSIDTTAQLFLRVDEVYGPSSTYFNIPPPATGGGNYTPSTLCAAIQTILNSPAFIAALEIGGLGCVGPFTSTCTYNPANRKMDILITCTSTIGADLDIRLYCAPPDGNFLQPFTQRGYSLAATMAGLNPWDNIFTTSATTFTFTSPAPLNVDGANYLTLHSTTLGALFRFQPNYYDQLNWYRTDVVGDTDQLITIPMDKSYGEIITWKNDDRAGFNKMYTSEQLATFDLYWTLGPWGHKLNFNNNGFTVKILVEVEDTELDQINTDY